MSLKTQVKKALPNSVKQWLFQRKLKQLEKERLRFVSEHPGEDFECNLCMNTAGSFMPDGENHKVLVELNVLSGGFRENCRCPHCYSKDRDRLIWFFLNRKTQLFRSAESKKLLHFAPEPVLKNQFKSISNLIYTDADLDPMLATHKMDITAIPLASNSQDAILCNHVLEHIPDDTLAMKELFRVLKPTGFGIFQVPIGLNLAQTIEDPQALSAAEREERFGQCDHVRIYGLDYPKRLESVGFLVEQHKPSSFLTKNEIERFGLLAEENIYYCIKP